MSSVTQEEIIISHKDNTKDFIVPTSKKYNFKLKTHYSGYLLEVEDVNFHTDSAVLLPDYETSGDKEKSLGRDRITGLAVLIACYRQARNYPDQKAIITGHTDTTGSKDYNVELSNLRAKNVLFALTGMKKDWVSICLKKHQVEDYQQILKWVDMTRSWGCDPGKIDNIAGENTRAATLAFQKRYNKEFKSSIKENGVVEASTWGAFFDVYMLSLMEILKSDKDELSDLQASISFIDSDHMSVGCGEFFPVEEKDKDNYRSETNRRVEILFFDPGEEPAFECHPKDGICLHDKCDLNNKLLYNYEVVPVEPPGPIGPKPPAEKYRIEIKKIDSKFFIPEIEDVSIEYEIFGPLEKISNMRMVISTEKEPDKQVFEKEINTPFKEVDTITWNGETTSSDFNGFVTLASSPYLIKITLETKNAERCESIKEKIEILPELVEIAIDDPGENKIPDDRKSIIQSLKNDINKSGKCKLIYDSSIFKTSSEQMNDDSSYIAYEEVFKEGIPVPVLARIWLKSKDGSKKRYPKALAGTKILWDVELENETEYDSSLTSVNMPAAAKSFVKKVAVYKKDETEPKGFTAHKFFGGERTKESDRTSVEKQWKALFDEWTVEYAKNRTWCAHSLCKIKEGLDYDTGLFFLGGRIAGDTHKITAYVDNADELDNVDDTKLKNAAKNFKSTTISITNWRKVFISNNFKVGASTQELVITDLIPRYQRAFMNMEIKPGLAVQEIQTRWKTFYKTEINSHASKNDFVKYAALDDPGLYPVKYRDYNDYRERIKNDPGLTGDLAKRKLDFFGAGDDDAYRNMCEKYSYDIYSNVAKNFPLNENGIAFFKFGEDGAHNMMQRKLVDGKYQTFYTAGIAPSITGYTDKNKAVFFLFEKKGSSHTLIHEVGHLLFLAHAPGHFFSGDKRTDKDPDGKVVIQPDGFQPNAHADNQWCVMSYHKSDPDELCGICIFKLRGWLYSRINKDGTIH